MAIQWVVAGAVRVEIAKLLPFSENKKVKRRVFFSFKYEDAWKTYQIRNSDNIASKYERGFVDKADREKIKRQTKSSIEKWISEQIHGTSVTCVLIGENTHKSKWVKYEIEQSIARGNGLLLIHMHEMKSSKQKRYKKGIIPSLAQGYDVYNWGSDDGKKNLDKWIEKSAQRAGR